MTVAVCLVRMNIDVLGIDGPVIWSQGQSIGPLFLPCGNKLIYEDLKAIERRMDIKVKCPYLPLIPLRIFLLPIPGIYTHIFKGTDCFPSQHLARLIGIGIHLC